VRFFIVINFFLVFLLVNHAFAQAQRLPPAGARDSLRTLRPPVPTNLLDTTKNVADTAQRKQPKGDINTTIVYSATDSINSSLDKKIMKLYGDAHIKYGEIELEADVITIDYNQSTIHAKGSLDSTGRRVGFPVFTNGNEQYEAHEMTYNLKTKKAVIHEVVTKQGDALMHSNNVFKTADNNILARRSAYTTCDLPDPHYRIISTKAKAIPGDKVVSGPFYMEFNHVPLPVGFAFGMFPSQIKATSGIIMPTYGEENRRGFFLRGGGYYFNINEFLDLTVTGDIYTKGSSALRFDSKYKVRYKYNGNFNFAYTSNRVSNSIEDLSRSKDFSLRWSHTPETKGNGRFSASVNGGTSSFTNNNFLGVNTNPQQVRLDNTTTKMNSNVSYSQTFPRAGITLGVNARHDQDLITKRYNFSLPDVSMNVNNIYPFRKIAKGISSLENINIRLSTTATNQITNSLGVQPKISSNTGEPIVLNGQIVTIDSVAPFNLANMSTFLRNAKKGIRHTVPLATSVKVLKYLTLSPSINVNELWYFDRLSWALDSTRTKAVAVDTMPGFNRITNFQFSMGLQTRIYGTRNFKAGSRIKAIRHVINPSISYSFQPDYTNPKYGYYQKFNALRNPRAVLTRPDGALGSKLRPDDFTEIVVARHQNFIYGASAQGRSQAVSFGINNSVEMKVKGKEDSVARKVSLLNSLSISSGYNFYATQFKLSQFGVSANTNVLDNKVNLNFNATLDPYQYRLDSIAEKTGLIYQTRIERLVWRDRLSLGNLTSASFAFSTNLNPKGNEKDKDTKAKISQSNLDDADKQDLMQRADAYVDFSIPWNVRLNYNVTYNKQGFLPSKVVQSLRLNGDFSLSENWKIAYNTGYDFELKQFTQTNFSLTRDLHCWTMSFNWVPFGQFQSYNFFIGIKSAMLKDLKINRTRSFFDLQN
jgi:hypothetical protein